jgi:hypothetical protein
VNPQLWFCAARHFGASIICGLCSFDLEDIRERQ